MVVVLACAGGGVALALHYPIAPMLVTFAFAGWIAVSMTFGGAWLFMIPALLPVIGFATWTGWIAYEELDIVVLGAAAGGYFRLALAGVITEPDEVADVRMSRTSRALVMLFAIAWTYALLHGISAGGGIEFDGIQSYHEGLNSLRVYKSFAFAVLLLPLAQSEFARRPQRTLDRFGAGIAVGCVLASAAVFWERAAFPGVLDFASDYRATAMFWEMHVGGAALDGYLALSVPFVVRQWFRAHRPAHSVLVAMLALLVAYACFATFSRGTYVALPLGLATVMVLQRRSAAHQNDLGAAALKLPIAATVVVATAFLAFTNGGYRAMAAVMLTLAVGTPLAVATRSVPAIPLFAVAGSGALLAVGLLTFAMQFAKGPYVLYAMLWAIAAALVWTSGKAGKHGLVATSCFAALAAASAGVALYWGGAVAGGESALAVAGASLLIFADARSVRPLWPTGWRAQSMALGAAAVTAGAVAVFSGGAYMADRLASTEHDFDLRMGHWNAGLRTLNNWPDWWLGKGLGRFPSSYFYDVDGGQFPGSYAIGRHDAERFLVLAGPRHPTGFGELFRVAQRVVPLPRSVYEVTLDLRSQHDTVLHVEICEKHLLYSEGCALAEAKIRRTGDSWQRLRVVLDGRAIKGEPWYAPRLAFFSMAVADAGEIVEIDNLSVRAANGENLIRNGDFSAGMARWFFTSDRDHLPWHIKNLELGLLFDQGIVGLVLFMLLALAALWRLILIARENEDAPFFAASLVGFLAVGTFDTLLDVPRVAFLFYLLVLVALALPRRVKLPTTCAR
jgi:hypothetical protein